MNGAAKLACVRLFRGPNLQLSDKDCHRPRRQKKRAAKRGPFSFSSVDQRQLAGRYFGRMLVTVLAAEQSHEVIGGPLQVPP